MELHEWSLVIFTTIMQMAVGAFVLLGGVHFFATRKFSLEAADKLSDRSLLAIGPVVVLAMLATFFHLGNPINAPRAVVHFASSWLSREIILAMIFVIGGAVFTYMQWRKVGSAQTRNIFAVLTAAVGLVLVYAMASIYLLPTVPAWDTAATPVSFFITTFLLGALALGAAYVTGYWNLRTRKLSDDDVQFEILATTLRWLALISIALLGVQFVVIPLYIVQLAANPSTAAEGTLSLLFGENGVTFVVRLLLVFLGAGVFAAFIYRLAASDRKTNVVGSLALLAFALVFVAEFIGRYLFYATMVNIGLG